MGIFTSVLSMVGLLGQPPKYISYTSYWGFSNQIIELKVAASWARFTGRTLILPRWAHSRNGNMLEPEECESSNHMCEPLVRLIDIGRLKKFVPVEIQQDHHLQNDSKYVIDFGIDFSVKENRIKYLVRWFSDKPGILGEEAYNTTISRGISPFPNWCHKGLLAGPYRCMRSAHELLWRQESTIHFPKFHTFAVGKLWSEDAARKMKLNHAVDSYVRPSKNVFRIARRVMAELGLVQNGFDAIHVRRGDFLTTKWANVENLSERARLLYNMSMAHESSYGNESHSVLFVATDDLEFIKKEGYKQLTSAGYGKVLTWPQHFIQRVSPLSRSLSEQIICARAHIFDAQEGSTWSQYVDLLRNKAEILQDARGRADDL